MESDERDVALRPPTDVEKMSILQKREDYLGAYAAYRQLERGGHIDPSQTKVVGARMEVLFLQCHALLARRLSVPAFTRLRDQVYSNDFEELLNAFLLINKVLDEIELTKIDTKKSLGGDIVKRNRAAGLY